MEFNLRKLQAPDLFTMVRLIRGVGIDNIKSAINFDELVQTNAEIQQVADEQDKAAKFNDAIKTTGISVVMSVIGVAIDKVPEMENDIYKFAGSLADMSAKDVAKLGALDFIDLLTAIVQMEEFADFFKRASKLIK